MPLPLIPLITAGASLLGQGMNAAFNSANNRRQQRFAENMYGLQRMDALHDWEMMNQYNSPANQMKRFTEAGLNPNLIYGSANNNVSPVRSSSAGNFSPEPNRVDMSAVTQPLMSIYDVQVKQAQTDNLKQQLEIAKQDTLLRSAQIAQVVASTAQAETSTAQGRFNLGQAQQLNSTVLEKASADLSKTYADTTFTLDQNARNAAMQASTLQQAIENILTSRLGRVKTGIEVEQTRQAIKNLKSSNVLMELDIRLKKLGIQPSDNAVLRIIPQILQGGNITENTKKILNNLSDSLGNDLLNPLNAVPGSWQKK